MRLLGRILGVLIAITLILVLAGLVLFGTIPDRSHGAPHVDALIVLGSPAGNDGKPTVVEKARVRGAVEEYRAGRADHIIFTGTAAHNRYFESRTMAKLAMAEGVPVSAIEIEDQSRTTVQNIYFSNLIMQAHGWHTAEVISDPAHLPRTVLILEHDHLTWQTHASAWPPHYPAWRIVVRYVYEFVDVSRYRLFGVPREDAAPIVIPV